MIFLRPLLLFPIRIVFVPVGSPLFVVVGMRHIHAVVYPFFVFPSVKLASLVLGPGVRARSGLTNILKFSCRCTGRVASLCGRILGCTASGVVGDILVIGTFLFQGRGQSDQNLVVVGTLLLSLADILVVCVQVYHIGGEDSGAES